MLNEFFGFNGFEREPEGFLSWQHITFVSSIMAAMLVLAFVLAQKKRNKCRNMQNKAIIVSAILMDTIEILKVSICCIWGEPMSWTDNLPLYMCSIQLITLPLAAFLKGRIRDAAVDFVMIFGLLGAVLGTYCAGQNYACYPVLSFGNVVSGITHSIAGFASLYIMFTGMATMKKCNIPITCAIILIFSAAAYIVNIALDCNYMFLMRGDGTPYDILYNIVNGSKVLYPIGVVALFVIYIAAYYTVFYFVRKPNHSLKNK